jgi:hypothetical protein
VEIPSVPIVSTGGPSPQEIAFLDTDISRRRIALRITSMSQPIDHPAQYRFTAPYTGVNCHAKSDGSLASIQEGEVVDVDDETLLGISFRRGDQSIVWMMNEKLRACLQAAEEELP